MKIEEKIYVAPCIDMIAQDNFLCADSADGSVTDFTEETFIWD